jgi:hypothetical protein
MLLSFLLPNASIAGHGLTGVVFFGVFILISSSSFSISIGSSGGKIAYVPFFVVFVCFKVS